LPAQWSVASSDTPTARGNVRRPDAFGPASAAAFLVLFVLGRECPNLRGRCPNLICGPDLCCALQPKLDHHMIAVAVRRERDVFEGAIPRCHLMCFSRCTSHRNRSARVRAGATLRQSKTWRRGLGKIRNVLSVAEMDGDCAPPGGGRTFLRRTLVIAAPSSWQSAGRLRLIFLQGASSEIWYSRGSEKTLAEVTE